MRGESRAHLLPPGAAATKRSRSFPSPEEGSRDLLFWDFPLPQRLGLRWEPGRGGGQGWTGRLRSASPGGAVPEGSAAGVTPPGTWKLQRAFRRGSKVPRRDRARSTSRQRGGAGPGLAGGAGGWRRRRLLPGPCPPPRRERGPPPAGSLTPSSIATCRPRSSGRALGAGCRMNMHMIKCTARAGEEAGGGRRGGQGAGGHQLRGFQPCGSTRVYLRSPLVPGAVWFSAGCAVGPLPCPLLAPCLTDPFLNSVGGVELQPLPTLQSNGVLLERLSCRFRTSAPVILTVRALKLSATFLLTSGPGFTSISVDKCISMMPFFPLKCVTNNSGGPFSTALLLNKCSNFPAASFALISYFIF